MLPGRAFDHLRTARLRLSPRSRQDLALVSVPGIAAEAVVPVEAVVAAPDTAAAPDTDSVPVSLPAADMLVADSPAADMPAVEAEAPAVGFAAGCPSL